MTQLQRLQSKLQRLRARQRELSLTGRLCTAWAMEGDIRRLEDEIEARTPKPLREFIDKATLDRLGLHRKIIALHLAADFLNDCCYDYTDTLRKLGLEDSTLTPEVAEIKRLSGNLAARLCKMGIQALSDFMVNNDKYIDALHGFTTAYINSKVALK